MDRTTGGGEREVRTNFKRDYLDMATALFIAKQLNKQMSNWCTCPVGGIFGS